MKDQLTIELLTKTLEYLSVGVGIFYVPDLKDIKSIRYVFMNKVLLYEMRKTREEVFGKKVTEVAPEAYEHEGGVLVLETYRKVAEEGGSINLGLVEYSNHMVAGIYECSVHQIKTNYVYVQLRNVTELELAKVELKHKKELERKNKELEQFTFITSHDLQEPLNSILSFAGLLEREKEKMGEVGQKSIEVIKASASRMRALIISLLEYSTIGREKGKKEVDIERLIEDLKVDLQQIIEKTKATVIYAGDNLKIQAYEPDLIKLFQNLIVNGIKYTEEGTYPVIIINAEEQKNFYKFSIQDTGIGIAKEYYEKVFEIFQRLHPGSQYSGTGIGLAYCKKVVELHGGEIWIASEEGKGTTFYFTIEKE